MRTMAGCRVRNAGATRFVRMALTIRRVGWTGSRQTCIRGGTFRGRFIRLTNVGNTLTAPQIAEIEVFEAPKPTVLYFGTDEGNITATGAPGKPSQAVLTWNVAGYTGLSIDQGIGTVAGPTSSVTVSPTTQTTYTLTAQNGTALRVHVTIQN